MVKRKTDWAKKAARHLYCTRSIDLEKRIANALRRAEKRGYKTGVRKYILVCKNCGAENVGELVGGKCRDCQKLARRRLPQKKGGAQK